MSTALHTVRFELIFEGQLIWVIWQTLITSFNFIIKARVITTTYTLITNNYSICVDKFIIFLSNESLNTKKYQMKTFKKCTYVYKDNHEQCKDVSTPGLLQKWTANTILNISNKEK